MTVLSPATRRADSTLSKIDRVLHEPPFAAPARAPEVAGSALYVSIAARRYRALAEAALEAVHNYSHGRPFPLNALVEELRDCGLLLSEEPAR